MRTAWLALAAAACSTPASSRPERSASQAAPIEPAAPSDASAPIEPAAPIEAAAPVAPSAPVDPAPEVGFRVLVAERTQLSVGQPGAVSLTVAPGPGYTISQVGPLRVDLSVKPPGGLEVPRRRYRREHAADRRADAPRFDLAVRGAKPGTYALAIDVRLWLCRARRCHPARRAVAPVIEVQGPAAPAPAAQR